MEYGGSQLFVTGVFNVNFGKNISGYETVHRDLGYGVNREKGEMFFGFFQRHMILW